MTDDKTFIIRNLPEELRTLFKIKPEGKMNRQNFIAKGIDKTVRDFALKHKINIRRDWNNDYMILDVLIPQTHINMLVHLA